MQPDTKRGIKTIGVLFGAAIYYQLCSNLWRLTDNVFSHAVLAVAFVTVPIAAWRGFKELSENKQSPSSDASTRKNITLAQKYQDTISKYCTQIFLNTKRYYIENHVRDCIGDIARSEGVPHLAPAYRECLLQWRARRHLPKEYRNLADHLEHIFGQKYTDRPPWE